MIIQSLFVISTFLTALPANEVKIAVVDFNRALNSVEEGKAAREELEGEAKKKEAEMKKRQGELEKMQAQIQDLERKMQTLQLSEAEKKRGMELQEKFGKLFKEGSELSEKYRQEMQTKKVDSEQKIIRKLRTIVEDMSRKDGYTMVFEKIESGLVYAAQADDLTERLIQKYNMEHKVKSKK